MAGLRPIFVTMVLVSLFSACLLAFAMQFISENNPSSSLATDQALNNSFNSLNNTLSNLQSGTKDIQLAVQQDKGDPVMIFLILKTMLTLPWQLFNLIWGGFTTVGYLVFSNVFGGDMLVVLSVINGIVVATIIFLVVKFIRTGESER